MEKKEKVVNVEETNDTVIEVKDNRKIMGILRKVGYGLGLVATMVVGIVIGRKIGDDNEEETETTETDTAA